MPNDWLPPSLVDDWRRSRVECLQRVVQVHPDGLASLLFIEDGGPLWDGLRSGLTRGRLRLLLGAQ